MTSVNSITPAKTRTVLIGDLVNTVSTWNPLRSNTEETFDYIDLSSVDQEAKMIVGARKISCADAPSRARQIVSKGDVLVSTVRPNLNGVACIPDDLDKATASTGFCVLRPRANELDGNYLFQWVKSPVFVSEMVKKATGASYPAVSDRIIFESKIPLPPLAEQKRIAAILDKADAIRRKLQQSLRLSDDFLRSVFLDMFGDPVTNPKGWKTVELQDAVKKGTIVTYGIVQAGTEFPGGVPYIRTGDIVNGVIRLSGLRRTDPSIAKKFERSTVRTGEIVMSIRATVGTTAVVTAALDGANLTQGTARISPGEKTLLPFLLFYLRSEGVQGWIQKQVKGATFAEITLGRLRELPVLIPPIANQKRFAMAYEKLEKVKAAQQKQLLDSSNLFSSLQQRAFRGEL